VRLYIMESAKYIFKVSIVFVMAFVCCVSTAQATANLSITPISGGSTLRFGRIDNLVEVNEEVRIRITTNEGKQYQVFQRMEAPLTNERSTTLDPHVMSVYTLSGSNGSGTLYAQNVEDLSYTDQLLYSSSTGGDSDSFTLSYIVNPEHIRGSGNYLGRIVYSLRVIGSPAQDSRELDVSLEAGGDIAIDVKGSLTNNSVSLIDGEKVSGDAYVQISFEDNVGEQIEIYLDVIQPLQDEKFNELSDAVYFQVSGGDNGALREYGELPLERKEVLIYSSQSSEDQMLVNFGFDKDVMQEKLAGRYKGTLRYTVKVGQAQEIFDINLDAEIQPVFKLEVDLLAQELSFDNLLPMSPPQLREVDVKVRSNLGKPFIVVQNVVSPMANEKGDEIPSDYFTMNSRLEDETTGKAGFSDFAPVVSGDVPVFFSDAQGSSAHFTMMYRLRPYPQMQAGNYTTSVRYSLGEM